MEVNDLLENIYSILGDEAEEDLRNNNANKDAGLFHTQRDFVAGEVSKYVVSQEIPAYLWKEYERGALHCHDLDYRMSGMTNCCLIDLGGMLEKGTVIGNATIESPKSITTAVAVTAQIVTAVTSFQYGGASIDRIDEVLAPYVRKSYDKHLSTGRRWTDSKEKAAIYAMEMVEKEVNSAMQSLEYEINTLSSTTGQTPFLTLGFGLGSSWESRMIQKGILQVRIKGLGKSGNTPVFPKLVYAIKEGHNAKAGDPNYDIKQLALECTAKRMYPDYVSYERVCAVTGDFKFPMGCRSFLSAIESGETAGRNNLGVVSINLPLIAIESGGSQTEFFHILEEYVDNAMAMHEWSFERLKRVRAKQAPILYMHGAFGVRLKANDLVWPIFENRASVSVGYLGVFEMLQVMWDDEEVNELDPACVDFVKEVLGYIKKRCEEKAKETKLGFSLYATPSESLCNRFNTKIAEAYPEYDWLTDKGYLTNSHHLDVRKKVAPNVKFDYESNFTPIANGGYISFVELPDMKKFLPALEWAVDYGLQHSHYIGVNTPVDECEDCGFMGESVASENGFICPHCKSENISVTRRVCGYLGAPGSRPFNYGKQQEVMQRVKHMNLK